VSAKTSELARVVTLLAVTLGLVSAGAVSADASQPKSYAYVVASPGLQVVDTETNTIVGSVAVYNADAVAVSPDGAYVYVGGQSALTVISTATDAVIATVPLFGDSDGVAISSDGHFAYVTSEDGVLYVVDTATDAVVATVTGGGESQGVAVTPDGSRVYTAERAGNSVRVISTGTNSVLTTVPWEGDPNEVAVTPDGKYAYATNLASEDSVAAIDTATNTIIKLIHTGKPVLGGQGRGVAVTPESKHVYVTNAEDDTVSVIDTATNAVVDTIPAGIYPARIALTPDGRFAYVSDYGTYPYLNGGVAVISTATNTVVATVPVSGPGHLAITPPITPSWLAAPTPTHSQTPTPTQSQTPTPTPTHSQTPRPKPISAALAFSLPSAKRCVSRRHFTMHIRTIPGITWARASIRINRKRVRTIGRSHITARIDLRGLPKGTFVLSIIATATNGRRATGARTYHTCVPKGKRHYRAPKL
jgi:YVTN family beta-propeller protein